MNPVALAASALIISLAGVSGAYAQSTTNGTIYGQVKPAPGVTVVIENVGTGAKRTTASERKSGVVMPRK